MKKKQKLKSKYGKWILLDKSRIGRISRTSKKGEWRNTNDEIIKILLSNRGVKTEKQRQEYFNPTDPEKIKLREAGINEEPLKKGIRRIYSALKNKEKVIIFGDYDVDGITSSAILWEYLYKIGVDVLPYLPDRFSEGYGIKPESIEKLKKKYPNLSLIIAVDNGVTAFEAVDKANFLGIDVIVIDHHEKGEVYPNSHCVIHTTKLCGAGISWFFVREIERSPKQVCVSHNTKSVRDDKTGLKSLPVLSNTKSPITNHQSLTAGLELAALGTVADQMPLIGINRCLVKYGLERLNTTQRVGLLALYQNSGLKKGNIGVYEINYCIAPRINAMGRLEKAIDSLRLLCIKNPAKAKELAELLGRTNTRRQKTVDETLERANKFLENAKKMQKIIILDDASYHEGVIGLAASKLTEEFWRPAIVISKGKEISKGSARSIYGFNIIGAIRSAKKLLIGGGGHEMAAGFSVKTSDIKKFKDVIYKYANRVINKKLLQKNLKADVLLNLTDLSFKLTKNIKEMGPFGVGNSQPSFFLQKCEVSDVRTVGTSANHLKMKLKDGTKIFDAIMFNAINTVDLFEPGQKIDIVYNLEENYWNGFTSLQLKVKDIRDSIETKDIFRPNSKSEARNPKQ